MILEDIKYQLDQFSSFDNVRLMFEVAGKKGVIYFSGKKIINASFDGKNDIDAFIELEDIKDQGIFQVSIGEVPPEETLNETLGEIIAKITGEEEKGSDETQDNSFNAVESYSSMDIGVNNEVVAAIGDKLSKISGVEGVVAIKLTGEPIYYKNINDADFESADSLFLFTQSKELGNIFNFNNLKSTICEANNYKKIIVSSDNVIYSLKIAPDVQLLKMQSEVVKLLELVSHGDK
jgi:hypothetical protein